MWTWVIRLGLKSSSVIVSITCNLTWLKIGMRHNDSNYLTCVHLMFSVSLTRLDKFATYIITRKLLIPWLFSDSAGTAAVSWGDLIWLKGPILYMYYSVTCFFLLQSRSRCYKDTVTVSKHPIKRETVPLNETFRVVMSQLYSNCPQQSPSSTVGGACSGLCEPTNQSRLGSPGGGLKETGTKDRGWTDVLQ